jgi:hypothetical protein
MALLKPGYWHSTYFSSGYWQEDYWPDFTGLGDSWRYYYGVKKKRRGEKLDVYRLALAYFTLIED